MSLTPKQNYLNFLNHEEIEWTPEAGKILWNRDMEEGETFTFDVMEEIASEGLNFWWTRYTDKSVGKGTVTGRISSTDGNWMNVALEDGVVFKGWTTVSDYDNDTELLTIDQIRADAMTTADSIVEDTTVTYYAAAFKSYTITYISDDDSPITVGMATASYPAYEEEDNEVEVVYPYCLHFVCKSTVFFRKMQTKATFCH